MNILTLFNMGNYGWYVWPAYIITLIIFGINLFQALREKKQIKHFIKLSLVKQKPRHEP